MLHRAAARLGPDELDALVSDRTLRDELEASAWKLLAAASTSAAGREVEDAWSVFVQEVKQTISNHNSTYAEEVAGVVVDTGRLPTDSTNETAE